VPPLASGTVARPNSRDVQEIDGSGRDAQRQRVPEHAPCRRRMGHPRGASRRRSRPRPNGDRRVTRRAPICRSALDPQMRVSQSESGVHALLRRLRRTAAAIPSLLCADGTEITMPPSNKTPTDRTTPLDRPRVATRHLPRASSTVSPHRSGNGLACRRRHRREFSRRASSRARLLQSCSDRAWSAPEISTVGASGLSFAEARHARPSVSISSISARSSTSTRSRRSGRAESLVQVRGRVTNNPARRAEPPPEQSPQPRTFLAGGKSATWRVLLRLRC
jgi:hypothetical protein